MYSIKYNLNLFTESPHYGKVVQLDTIEKKIKNAYRNLHIVKKITEEKYKIKLKYYKIKRELDCLYFYLTK